MTQIDTIVSYVRFADGTEVSEWVNEWAFGGEVFEWLQLSADDLMMSLIENDGIKCAWGPRSETGSG